MIYAYEKVYLDKVQKNIGAMFDYAVNDLNVELVVFAKRYAQSDLARLQSAGDIGALIGKSGVEMALEVLDMSDEWVEPSVKTGRSAEYWTGWVLAYYQWYRNKTFASIIQEVPIDSIYKLYNPYHEMDIMQVVNRLNELAMCKRVSSYLKLFRERAGYSQGQLADITGIPVKTIQQYEQRRKDLNKAQAEYVIKLSMALHCQPMDLLENNGK